jgi:hypothetical protein
MTSLPAGKLHIPFMAQYYIMHVKDVYVLTRICYSLHHGNASYMLFSLALMADGLDKSHRKINISWYCTLFYMDSTPIKHLTRVGWQRIISDFTCFFNRGLEYDEIAAQSFHILGNA